MKIGQHLAKLFAKNTCHIFMGDSVYSWRLMCSNVSLLLTADLVLKLISFVDFNWHRFVIVCRLSAVVCDSSVL